MRVMINISSLKESWGLQQCTQCAECFSWHRKHSVHEVWITVILGAVHSFRLPSPISHPHGPFTSYLHVKYAAPVSFPGGWNFWVLHALPGSLQPRFLLVLAVHTCLGMGCRMILWEELPQGLWSPMNREGPVSARNVQLMWSEALCTTHIRSSWTAWKNSGTWDTTLPRGRFIIQVKLGLCILSVLFKVAWWCIALVMCVSIGRTRFTY